MTCVSQTRVMPLSKLLTDVPGSGIAVECYVKGLCTDSRKLTQGDLFFALSKSAEQRQIHIESAITSGATAILADTDIALLRPVDPAVPVAFIPELRRYCGTIARRFYARTEPDPPIIGITGTNGKTSVSQFVAQLLGGSALAPAGLIGTLGYGSLERLTAHDMTTPGAVELQGILAGLVASSCRSVIMEVSSHALDQGRVDDLAFETAVLTNLTRDHLDYHADMQAYAAAKRRLFFQRGLRRAIINCDDAFGRDLIGQLPPEVTTLGYGVEDLPLPGNRQAEIRLIARNVVCDARGISMEITGSYGSLPVVSRLLGRFNVLNILAAAAVALLHGVALPDLRRRIEDLQPVPGRFERFGGGAGQPLVVVDFAHTPDGLEQALSSLREITDGELWCVFGCGGDRDRGKRPLMGTAAARRADHVILTSDNPRSEDPLQIIADIQGGIPATVDLHSEPDRQQAIRSAVLHAKSTDVILIAGKGHERYQEIRGKRHPYSDHDFVRSLLSEGR